MKTQISSFIIVLETGTKKNYLDILEKFCEAGVTGEIMTGNNWRFGLIPPYFSPSIITPVVIKNAIIFLKK